MQSTNIVLSFGGSVINSGKIDVKAISELSKVIQKYAKTHKFGIVTGGGRYARDYIKAAKELGANEFYADTIAIMETKQNAFLLMTALDNVYPKVADDFIEAKKALSSYNIVVMGGTVPGMTTDSDALLLAEALKAKKMINISRVGAIYDKDPSKKGAKKIKEIHIDKLIKMASKVDERKAGTNFPLDLFSLLLAKRSSISIDVIPPVALDLENAIKGKKHNGTIVKV